MELSRDEQRRIEKECEMAVEARNPDIILDYFERGIKYIVRHDGRTQTPIRILEAWISEISRQWPYPSFERQFQWRLRMARLDRSCIDGMLLACARTFQSRDMLGYYAAEFDQNVDEVLAKYELFYTEHITWEQLVRLDIFDLLGYYPAFDRIFELYMRCEASRKRFVGRELTGIFVGNPYGIRPGQLLMLAQHMKRCYALKLSAIIKKKYFKCLHNVQDKLQALQEASETNSLIPDALAADYAMETPETICILNILGCAARNKTADYWAIKRILCVIEPCYLDQIALFVRSATPEQAQEFVRSRELPNCYNRWKTYEIMELVESRGGSVADAAWRCVARTPETEHMHRTVYGVSIDEHRARLDSAELFAHIVCIM